MRKLIPALAFLLGALCLPALAQTADVDDGDDGDGEVIAPAQIHVTAQRPGPGLWKVRHGDNVLWLFGSYGPLPVNMEWRSQQVEKAISQSQEYLAPPSATAKPGFFKAITLLPHLIGLRNNPDGATLRDLLSEQDYARWQELKTRYGITKDSVERERPVFAAETLARAARQQASLAPEHKVTGKVWDLAKQHKLKLTKSSIMIPMDNARTALKNVKKTGLSDTVCLSSTMATIERDIAEASERAEAWALGDIAKLRSLNLGAEKQACFAAMMDSAALDSMPEMRTMMTDAQALWLKNAETALATNRSTFAMLKMADILAPYGLLARLAEKGYTVEEPGSEARR